MAHRIERFSTEIEACLAEKFPDVFDPLICNLLPYENTRGRDEVSMDEDFDKDSLVEEIRKISLDPNGDKVAFVSDGNSMGIAANPTFLDLSKQIVVVGSRRSSRIIRELMQQTLLLIRGTSSMIFYMAIVKQSQARITLLEEWGDWEVSREVNRLTLEVVDELDQNNNVISKDFLDRRGVIIILVVSSIWNGGRLMDYILQVHMILASGMWRRPYSLGGLYRSFDVGNVVDFLVKAVWFILKFLIPKL